MNKILPTIAIFLFTAVFAAGQPVEKTLVKSFNLHGNETVTLDLPGSVEVKTWKSPTMRVQLNIALPNSNVALLKTLVQYGRYNLIATQESEGIKVFAPGLKKPVKVGDRRLDEKVSFLVFAPEGVQIEIPDAASTFLAPADAPGGL